MTALISIDYPHDIIDSHKQNCYEKINEDYLANHQNPVTRFNHINHQYALNHFKNRLCAPIISRYLIKPPPIEE